MIHAVCTGSFVLLSLSYRAEGFCCCCADAYSYKEEREKNNVYLWQTLIQYTQNT